MPEQTTVVTPEGFTVLKNDSHISRWVEQSKRLDIQDGQISPWLNSLPLNGFAIDIGAFIGDTAASISKRLGSSGLLLCIEPSIDGFECLVKNVRLLGPCTIRCYNVAVGREKGVAEYNQDPNAGASHIVQKVDSTQGDVLTIPLDDILAESSETRTRKVDFIKIDVEGWELGVLAGAEKTITEHKPDLLIEINEGALARQGATPNDIYEFLSSKGYAFMITDNSCDYGDPQYDIYCSYVAKGPRTSGILR